MMTRTFVVGDIHGCFDEMMELFEKVNLQPDDLVISVGDIVDRGNKSLEVYHFFRNRPNSVVLMGNHERKHINHILSYAQEIVKVQFKDEYLDFLNWAKTLPYYYETPEAIVVHAAFEHDMPLAEQREEVLCGSTSGERYLESKYTPNTYWTEYYRGLKPVIFGHHVVGNSPKIHNNTYGIDTGCCHGDFLTMVELPSFVVYQVRAKKDYWKEEQVLWQVPVLESKDWENTAFEALEKQFEKLRYIEEPKARSYLNKLEQWAGDLKYYLPVVKQRLDDFVKHLLATNPEGFTQEANQYPFSTYLFKSRANNLHLKDLEKSLNTPRKVLDITGVLHKYSIP